MTAYLDKSNTNREYLDRAKATFKPYYKRELTDGETLEILNNLMHLFLYLQELNNKYKVVKPKKATYKKQKDKGGNNEKKRTNKGRKTSKN